MKTLQEEREAIVEEFFNKFFPDLADRVHQEQSDWLRHALLSHEEKVVARVREEIRKSFDAWFKNGTEDVEDWADRTLPITDEV